MGFQEFFALKKCHFAKCSTILLNNRSPLLWFFEASVALKSQLIPIMDHHGWLEYVVEMFFSENEGTPPSGLSQFSLDGVKPLIPYLQGLFTNPSYFDVPWCVQIYIYIITWFWPIAICPYQMGHPHHRTSPPSWKRKSKVSHENETIQPDDAMIEATKPPWFLGK